MKLEICANSYRSAANADLAVAHRIELCQELSVGGITPSYGLLKKVADELSIKAMILIRPRSGNFVYSNTEFEIMKQDISVCKTLGFFGIVSGVLNENQTIDMERTKELVELSKPLQFTFHRAFDCVPNPIEAIEQLITIGVHRILTSGQEASAEAGLELLKQLKKIAQDRIIILPGGGIKAQNCAKFKQAGFEEIHSSASVKVATSQLIGSKFEEFSSNTSFSGLEKIKELLGEIS